jgi:hypothetical protein
MSRPEVRPLTAEELRHPLRTAFAARPQDAERALRWLRRGPLATSIMPPPAVRATILPGLSERRLR